MVRRHALCRSVKNMYDITAENPVIPDKFSIPEAMNFAWSLPISTLITGAENKEFLEEKIMLSKNFAILDTDEKNPDHRKRVRPVNLWQIGIHKNIFWRGKNGGDGSCLEKIGVVGIRSRSEMRRDGLWRDAAATLRQENRPPDHLLRILEFLNLVIPQSGS